MANPSLQIGNSNWAIKEDNLLGYSTAGTRFLPQPITMTRASAGTRVNPQGLVETVELLGSEDITDGSFPTGTTAWSITNNTGTNTRIENNHLIIETDGTYTQVIQSNALIIGKNYKLVYDVTATDGGDLGLETGGATSLIPSTIGTHTFYWVSNSTTFNLKRYGGALNITLDNVSVKESTKNNLARVDYDGTASSLLVEPQRTNLITYSNSNGLNFTFDNVNMTYNSIVSPDGLTNGILLEQTGSNAANSAYNYGLTNTDGDYTYSIYIKAKDSTSVRLYQSDGSAVIQSFNPQTMTSGIESGSLNLNFEDVGNGWFRVSFTRTLASAPYQRFSIYPDRNNTQKGVYIYGLQIEQGSYPTSYIPTSGSTVTRVQDQYSKTGISNLINSEEGTLFVEMAALSELTDSRVISINNGTSNYYIWLNYTSVSNTIRYVYGFLGANYADLQTVVADATINSKIAMTWKVNEFKFFINGVKISEDLSGAVMPSGTLNKLEFNRANGTEKMNGKVKQLQVFKTALTDTELATLTT